MNKYYVYIMANKWNTVFYTGVTNNLTRRADEHLYASVADFTKKYQIKKIVYVEEYNSIIEAIQREKQLKNWHREWKINLVRSMNPMFKDLTQE
jgi:putative endonuclease